MSVHGSVSGKNMGRSFVSKSNFRSQCNAQDRNLGHLVRRLYGLGRKINLQNVIDLQNVIGLALQPTPIRNARGRLLMRHFPEGGDPFSSASLNFDER